MKQKIAVMLMGVACLLFACATFAFSQDTPDVLSGVEMESDVQWLWGDVVSVDTSKNTILLKYVDYDTEQDKEITIDVNDQTTYENTKSLTEIKPQDTLSIDYIISPEGKNIAKNISLEKPDSSDMQPAQEPSMEQPSMGVLPTEPLDIQPAQGAPTQEPSMEAEPQESESADTGYDTE